jgi:hypothetical protein
MENVDRGQGRREIDEKYRRKFSSCDIGTIR